MSEVNRSRNDKIGLGVVALIAICAAVWLLVDAAQLQSWYQQRAENQAQEYAEKSNVEIGGRCGDLAPQAQANCVNQEREAAREGQRKEYDLEAQRVMSVWTRAMGIAAVIGMGVGIFGVWLIFTTFRETQRAAKSSAAAADAALASLKAFRDIEDANIKAVTADASFVRAQKRDFGRFLANIGFQPSGRAEPKEVMFVRIASEEIDWSRVNPEDGQRGRDEGLDVEHFHDRPFWLYGAIQYFSATVDGPRRTYFAFRMEPIPESERRVRRKKDHLSYDTHSVAERLEPPDRPADT